MTALSQASRNLNSFFSFGVCIRSGEPSDIDIFLLVLDERLASLAIFYLPLSLLHLLFSPQFLSFSFFKITAGFISEKSSVPTLFRFGGTNYAFLPRMGTVANKR